MDLSLLEFADIPGAGVYDRLGSVVSIGSPKKLRGGLGRQSTDRIHGKYDLEIPDRQSDIGTYPANTQNQLISNARQSNFELAMIVSVFSDASICTRKRVGGWGAWLKSDRGSIRTGGSFKHQISDITIAEAMAAINGLVAGLQAQLIHSGDRVILQTDNNSVQGILLGETKRKATTKAKRRRNIPWKQLRREVSTANHEISLVAEAYGKLLATYSLDIEWRHVKGHRGTQDRRAAVNTCCDQIAGDHMRTARHMKIKPRPRFPGA